METTHIQLRKEFAVIPATQNLLFRRLFPIKMNNPISYEVTRTHEEYQDITSDLEKRDFEIVEKIPFMTIYSNVETEEKVVVCIV